MMADTTWEFDPREGVLRVAGLEVKFTKMESRALDYLGKRAGEVVERKALEQEVWGIVSGVRSQTVPVTMRTIRTKLRKAGLDILVFVRGVGYKVEGYPRTRQPALPEFGIPLFDRPAEVHAVQHLLDEGWRVVSVVGPGGAGKTRLINAVARKRLERLIYVDLSSARSEADVTLAVVRAAGMVGGGLIGLSGALSETPSIFVLDEVELVADAVGGVIDALPQHRFLLSSQVALGRRDEAVHGVAPMVGEEGRRFIQARMPASRWQGTPADEVLDRLIDAVDGLPLAIEVVVAHPEAPETLLQQLEKGVLPSGKAGQPLQDALARSYGYLQPPERALLHHLCVAGVVLPTKHILHWHGESAVDQLEELSRRSLLHREGAGWRVLTTMRTFVLERLEGGEVSEFRKWLFEYLSEAAERMEFEPQDTSLDVMSLVEPARQAMAACPADRVSDVLWVFLVCGLIRGPYTMYDEVCRLVAPRREEVPIVALIQCVQGWMPESPELVDLAASLGAKEQYRLFLIQNFMWLPQKRGLQGWYPQSSDPLLAVFLQLLSVPLNTPEEIAAARQLTMSVPERKIQSWMMRFLLARRLRQAGNSLQSIVEWRSLIDALREVRLPGAMLFAKHALADAWVGLDDEEAALAFQDIAEIAESCGFGDSWVAGRSGVWLCLLGRWAEAQRWLQMGTDEPHLPARLTCLALLWALRHPHRADSLLDLNGIDGVLNDGTELRALVEAVATRTPLRGETTAARVWARTLKGLDKTT